MRSVPRLVSALAAACALGAPAVAQASDTSPIMASTPLAYYPLNESSGNVVADAGPNHLDATSVNAALGAAAPFAAAGTAVTLASATAHIDGPAIIGASSVELWVKPITNNRRQPLVSAGSPNDASGAWQLWVAPNKKVWLTANGVNAATKITLPKGAWSLLTVTWDGSTARFYLNGLLRSTPAFGAVPTGGVLRVGSTDTDTFKGTVDEVALFGHVLGAAEITSHYHASSLPYAATAPYITGVAQVGHDLTVTDASWSGADSTARQWQRCDASTCSDIGGATGPSYSLTAQDLDDTIQVQETATNTFGSVAFDSVEVGPVVGADQPTPPAVQPPSVIDPGGNPPTDPGAVSSVDPGSASAPAQDVARASDSGPAPTDTRAASSDQVVVARSATSCVATAARRRSVFLPGVGRVTLSVGPVRGGSTKIGISLRSPRGKVKYVGYRLDTAAAIRVAHAPFRRSAALPRPGVHRLRATVRPRHGRGRVVTVRLMVKGC